jgi:MFS family permease
VSSASPGKDTSGTGESQPEPEMPKSVLGRRLYLFSALIDTIGGGMWMPVTLIFFIDAKGFSATEVGVAVTIGGIVGLLAGPLGGSLVDKRGPAPMIVISNLLCASVFLLNTFVSAVWQISVLSALFAASDRLFWTANAPLLERMVPEGRKLDRALGSQGVLRIIGLGAGAGLSGLFIGNIQGLYTIAYANSVSYVLAAAITLYAVRLAGVLHAPAAAPPDDPDEAPQAWGKVLSDRPYLMLCLAQVQFGLAARSFIVILPVVAIHNLGGPSWLPGASIVVSNALLAVIQSPVVRWSERRSRLLVLNIAAVVFCVSFLLLAPAEALGSDWAIPIVIAVALLTAVAEAGFGPLLIAAANQAAPEGFKGRYSATLQTSWGVANVLAPALFTALLALGNFVLWLAMAVILILVVPALGYAANRLPAGCLRPSAVVATV